MRPTAILAGILIFAAAAALHSYDITKATLLKNIKEFNLKNGLKVIVKEESSIPLVGFSVTYRAGFRNEDVADGKTGLTHLLEHMMFEATSNYAKGQISRALADAGADFNAFTTYDKTVYFEVLPKGGLETAVRLEADRMVNLLLDRADFEREREVVLSELNKDETSPDLKLWRKYCETAYGKHPLSAVYGVLDDVKKADRDYVYTNIYRRYYRPNNAYIVVVGDVRASEVMPLIEKYFGGLQPNKDLPKEKPIPLRVTNGVNVTMDGEASEDFGWMMFNLPPRDVSNRDSVVLSFIEQAQILGDFSYEAYMDGGIGEIQYAREPEYPAETLDPDYVVSNINLFKETYFNRETLGYDSVRSIMMSLLSYERYSGWNEYQKLLEGFDSVTPEEVVAVIKKYFQRTNANTAFFHAVKKDKRLQQEGVSGTSESFNQGIDYSDLDRPTAGSLKNAKDIGDALFNDMQVSVSSYLSNVREVRLSNGLTVIYKPYSLNQKLSIFVGVRAGTIYQKRPEQASTTRYLVFGGGPQISILNELEKRGVTVQGDADYNFATLSVSLPVDYFDPAVNMLGLALKDRVFLPLALEESRFDDTNALEKRKTSPSLDYRCRDQINRMIMGNRGGGMDFFAEPADIFGLGMKDVDEFYSACYRPENTVVVVVGNVDFDRVVKKLDRVLGGWRPGPAAFRPEEPSIETPFGDSTARVYVPSLQSVVMLAAPTVPYADMTNYIGWTLANSIFGSGGETCRLMRSIRDKYGLTYAVGTFPVPYGDRTIFRMYMQNAKENVQKALALYRAELKSYKDGGPTEMEVLKFKNEMLYSILFEYENGEKIASRLLYLKMRRGKYNYDEDYIRIMRLFDRTALTEIIRRYFPDSYFISIAGE